MIQKEDLSELLAEQNFFLNGFCAFQENSATPCCAFGRNEKINFQWNSNGNYFRLLYSDPNIGNTPVWEGTQTDYLFSDGCSRDTVFILEAKYQVGVIPYFLYQTIVVTVIEPDLKINSGYTNNLSCKNIEIETVLFQKNGNQNIPSKTFGNNAAPVLSVSHIEMLERNPKI